MCQFWARVWDVILFYVLFTCSLDQATGQLREIVAQQVGGEMVLDKMIKDQKALAYIHNGVQFIRLQNHNWSDTHNMGIETTVGGTNTGPQTLQGYNLDSLADFFASSIENAFSGQNEILDIGGTRLMQAHTAGLNMMRTNMNQLALTMPDHGSVGFIPLPLLIFEPFKKCTEHFTNENRHFIF